VEKLKKITYSRSIEAKRLLFVQHAIDHYDGLMKQGGHTSRGQPSITSEDMEWRDNITSAKSMVNQYSFDLDDAARELEIPEAELSRYLQYNDYGAGVVLTPEGQELVDRVRRLQPSKDDPSG
jgi:hypothetical protein